MRLRLTRRKRRFFTIIITAFGLIAQYSHTRGEINNSKLGLLNLRNRSGCAALLRRAGALDVEAAKAAGVQPGRSFGELKAGRAVQTASGEWVQPEQVSCAAK